MACRDKLKVRFYHLLTLLNPDHFSEDRFLSEATPFRNKEKSRYVLQNFS